MTRTETQVQAVEDEDFTHFTQQLASLTNRDHEREQRVNRRWVSSAERYDRGCQEVVQEIQMTNRVVSNAANELDHYPLSRKKVPIVCDPRDDELYGVLHWRPTLVPIRDITHLEWTRYRGSKSFLVTDTARNNEINQQNFELHQEMDRMYQGKMYKCGYCGKSTSPPKRSRVLAHMETCKEKGDEEKQPVEVSLHQHQTLISLKPKLTEEERRESRRAVNKKTAQRRKQERAVNCPRAVMTAEERAEARRASNRRTAERRKEQRALNSTRNAETIEATTADSVPMEGVIDSEPSDTIVATSTPCELVESEVQCVSTVTSVLAGLLDATVLSVGSETPVASSCENTTSTEMPSAVAHE